MDPDPILVTLPEPLLRAAREVARQREITVQQLIRDALASEIARAHRSAKSPVRADERLVNMLRAKLAQDFAYASNWWDLIHRLHDKDIHLREAGGGLALFAAQGGARLCKASDIGYSLNQLARRFRAPFPGDKMGNAALCAATTHSHETEVIDLTDRKVLRTERF